MAQVVSSAGSSTSVESTVLAVLKRQLLVSAHHVVASRVVERLVSEYLERWARIPVPVKKVCRCSMCGHQSMHNLTRASICLMQQVLPSPIPVQATASSQRSAVSLAPVSKEDTVPAVGYPPGPYTLIMAMETPKAPLVRLKVVQWDEVLLLRAPGLLHIS